MKLQLLAPRRSTFTCVVCAALLAWLASSCQSDETARDTTPEVAGPSAPVLALETAGPSAPARPRLEPASAASWTSYGTGITTAAGAPASIPLAVVLAEPQTWNGRRFVLEGTVDNVCPKKGCWMTMSSGGREMRVTFTDYGYFVPMDIHGSTARMEGVFAITETSVADARHYLEDAGQYEEARKITAPVKTFSFVADGVAIAR